MIPFVVYSHTNYLKILEIQTDYNRKVKDGNELILIINKTDRINNIIKQYDKVVFYDDSLPYATALKNSLEQIEHEYIVLFHDFDILLNVNQVAINNFLKFLKEKNFDRIDLKHTFNLCSSTIIDTKDWLGTKERVYLVRAENPKDYIYNVNPAIWKTKTYIDILNQFKDSNYREIEYVAQEYCMKYNIFKMHNKDWIECGWFFCLELFKFLHITHHGEVLPLNNEYMTPSRQSYASVSKEYTDIYTKYKLNELQLKRHLI